MSSSRKALVMGKLLTGNGPEFSGTPLSRMWRMQGK
jgi:hypothetical protein